MPFAPVRFAAREGEGEGRTGFTRFLRRKKAPAIVSAGNAPTSGFGSKAGAGVNELRSRRTGDNRGQAGIELGKSGSGDP